MDCWEIGSAVEAPGRRAQVALAARPREDYSGPERAATNISLPDSCLQQIFLARHWLASAELSAIAVGVPILDASAWLEHIGDLQFHE